MHITPSAAITAMLAFALSTAALSGEEINNLWDKAELFSTPTVNVGTFTDDGSCQMAQVTFSGLANQHVATAWLAVPKNLNGQKAPAVVLLHGGGGTASPEWAKQWAEKGYVAISPNLNYNNSMSIDRTFVQRAFGSAKNMWPYLAVATAIQAVSVVAAQSDVDASRIAMMGISWGGYLTCIAASIDQRVKVAIPVYGCGFYDAAEPGLGWSGPLGFGQNISGFLGPKEAREWIQQFDCKQYLPLMDRPILFATGTWDPYFPLNTHEKSIKLPTGAVASRIIKEWPHSPQAAYAAPELIAFADHYVNHGAALVRFTGAGTSNGSTWTTYAPEVEVQSAGLTFTTDTANSWSGRAWGDAPAQIDNGSHKITATVPAGAVGWFFSVTDSRGYVMTSPIQMLPGTDLPPRSLPAENWVRLSTTGWTATTSGIGPGVAGIDGLLNSQAGPAISGSPQHSGDFFQVDMGAPQQVTAVVLYSYTSPQRYAVTASDDGVNWGAPIATGEGGGNNMVIISFTPLTTRFLHVELTADAPNSWSVYEFSAFGPGVATPPRVSQVRATFGTRSGEPNWDGTSDLNGDLRVDAIDLDLATSAAHP